MKLQSSFVNHSIFLVVDSTENILNSESQTPKVIPKYLLFIETLILIKKIGHLNR